MLKKSIEKVKMVTATKPQTKTELECEAEQLKNGIFAEPLAATLTIPFAFFGPLAWNLSWPCLIFFSWLLKTRHKNKTDREKLLNPES